MEYRRLQKSKGGSFLISIPKEWVMKNKLDSGSILKIVESEGGSLIISVEGEELESQTSFIKEEENLEKQIRTHYLMGADIIVIDLKTKITPMIRERVKEAISKLIGLEIVEEGTNTITIQCLLQPTSMPLINILKRAYSLAASMHKDAEEALLNNDIERAEIVIKRDEEVDRLYFLIVRQLRSAVRNQRLAEKLGIKVVECLDLRMAAKYIESIADYSEGIAKNVRKIYGEKINYEIMDGLKELSKTAYLLHYDAINALFKRDVKIANKVIEKNKELVDKMISVNELLSNKQQKFSTILNTVAMYMYNIGECGIDLAELVGY
ncbi:MAG: phosphate uptake regulator PhoU [candidate division WOR-3 bacterium]|nr:phosphate uptake regulator PhoU [Candidatus Verstraetearchaeota archaeon]